MRLESLSKANDNISFEQIEESLGSIMKIIIVNGPNLELIRRKRARNLWILTSLIGN
jgi:hypothetical protein